MNKKKFSKTAGFTLIELMIVVSVMSILTAAYYRFYHEGLQKGVFHSRGAAAVTDARTLFHFIEDDLRHANGIVNSFGNMKSDKDTLIIKAISPDDRVRISSTSGDLTGGDVNDGGDCIIVYGINELLEVVREVYTGKILPESDNATRTEKKKVFKLKFRDRTLHHASTARFASESYSKTVLLGDVERFAFTYAKNRPDTASWVRLSLAQEERDGDLFSIGALSRIFSTGWI